MIFTITCTTADRDEHGHHGRAIQHAIDTVSNQRGGRVQLAAGTYILRGPLRLRSNVILAGEGPQTILTAVPFAVSRLAEDADVGQKEIHPLSTIGFLPGSGVILMDTRNGNAMVKMPLTVQHIQNGALYVDDFIINDWIAEAGGVVINYFPMIHASQVYNVGIADLTVDQRRDGDGPVLERNVWGAGIYSQRVDGMRVERVVVENSYGDGLRSGQSRDVSWLSCVIRNNTHYGVHPGGHTKRVDISDCDIHGNGSDGLYACWGVDQSRFCRNQIHHNGYRLHRNGFCIGHKDTDNLIEGNHIHHNAKHGIHVRIKTPANGAHRNVFRNNLIEDNGRPAAEIPSIPPGTPISAAGEGAGIFINGVTHDLVFENNTIRNVTGHQRRGVFVGPDVINARFTGNLITGHEIDVDGVGLETQAVLT